MLDELENRKRRRLYLAQSDSRIRIIRVNGTEVSEKTEGHLYDISQNGMRFGVNRALKSEDLIETEVLLSRSPMLLLKISGTLVREHRGACLPDEEIWEETMESDVQNSCLGRKDPHIYGLSFDFKEDMETFSKLAKFLQQHFITTNSSE